MDIHYHYLTDEVKEEVCERVRSYYPLVPLETIDSVLAKRNPLIAFESRTIVDEALTIFSEVSDINKKMDTERATRYELVNNLVWEIVRSKDQLLIESPIIRQMQVLSMEFEPSTDQFFIKLNKWIDSNEDRLLNIVELSSYSALRKGYELIEK